MKVDGVLLRYCPGGMKQTPWWRFEAYGRQLSAHKTSKGWYWLLCLEASSRRDKKVYPRLTDAVRAAIQYCQKNPVEG